MGPKLQDGPPTSKDEYVVVFRGRAARRVAAGKRLEAWKAGADRRAAALVPDVHSPSRAPGGRCGAAARDDGTGEDPAREPNARGRAREAKDCAAKCEALRPDVEPRLREGKSEQAIVDFINRQVEKDPSCAASSSLRDREVQAQARVRHAQDGQTIRNSMK